MTSATQVLTQRIAKTSRFSMFSIIKQHLAIFTLIGLLLVSAFGVVYMRDLHRRLFIDLQTAQKTTDTLQVEWGQLLLEQSTWAAPSRTQELAQDNLDMQVPALRSINLVAISH
jgi:cell division protein FtsL